MGGKRKKDPMFFHHKLTDESMLRLRRVIARRGYEGAAQELRCGVATISKALLGPLKEETRDRLAAALETVA